MGKVKKNSGRPVSWARFEPKTSRNRIKC